MKAVLTVIGNDKLGIIARVSTALFDLNINIEDISQTILQNYFTMIMMLDTKDCKIAFSEIVKAMETLGKNLNVEIKVQHEDIFNSMHKI